MNFLVCFDTRVNATTKGLLITDLDCLQDTCFWDTVNVAATGARARCQIGGADKTVTLSTVPG